jgi:hypothetical protein
VKLYRFDGPIRARADQSAEIHVQPESLVELKKVDSPIRCPENRFGTARKSGDEALPCRFEGWLPAYLPDSGATKQGYSVQHKRFSMKLPRTPQNSIPYKGKNFLIS